MWVHVGDRYSDIFDFMVACRQCGSHFLVRACQDRRVKSDDPRLNHLMAFVRSLPAQGERIAEIPARQARIAISFARVTLQPPPHSPHRPPLVVWVIRAWEPDPPPEVEEPLEWILLTSVPTVTLA